MRRQTAIPYLSWHSLVCQSSNWYHLQMQNSFKVSTRGLLLRSAVQICDFILKQTDDVQVLCQKAPLTYEVIVLSDMNKDLGTIKVSYKKYLKLNMVAGWWAGRISFFPYNYETSHLRVSRDEKWQFWPRPHQKHYTSCREENCISRC